MTNDQHLRTNQSMRIGEIMPLCLKNMKQQMIKHRAKTSYLVAKTEKTPANPANSISSVFGSLAGFIFLALLILVVFAPKSFWFGLAEFFKSKPIESGK